MSRRLREIARPAPVFGDRDALEAALDELAAGRPALVRTDGLLQFVAPSDAVGYPVNRRLVDLPLARAVTALAEATLPEVIMFGQGHEFVATELAPGAWGIASRAEILEALVQSVVPLGEAFATTTVLDLLDHSPEGIVVLDGRRRVHACNSTGTRILTALGVPLDGTPVDAICGVPIEPLLEDTRHGVPRDLATHEPSVRTFTVRTLGAGRTTPDAVVMVLRDVTHLRHRQARESEQERLELLGGLSLGIVHDLNNLLTIIMGETSLLDPSGLSDEARETVTAVRSASARSALLLRQLLSFGRRELAAPVVLQIPALLHDLEGLLRRLAGDRIRLRISVGDAVAPVLADPVQIERIIMNLATNARDAMPEGGDLQVEVTNAPPATEGGGRPGVRLTVQDTGVGMSEETAARAFEPGFTTKGQRGHGLGLVNVHTTVDQLGGRLHLHTSPGQGSRFDILLPAHTGYNPARSIANGPARSRERHPRHSGQIVVFDRDPEVGRFVLRVLHLEGFGVACGTTVEETLDRIAASGEPDLFIADLFVGGAFDGALLHQLRERFPGLRSLLVGGVSDELLLREAEDPLVEYLAKPFTAQELISRVRGIVGDPVDARER